MGLVYAATSNEAVFPTIACRAAFGVVKRIPSADSSAAPSAASLGGTLIQILTRGKGIDGRFDDCVDWIIRKVGLLCYLTRHLPADMRSGSTNPERFGGGV